MFSTEHTEQTDTSATGIPFRDHLLRHSDAGRESDPERLGPHGNGLKYERICKTMTNIPQSCYYGVPGEPEKQKSYTIKITQLLLHKKSYTTRREGKKPEAEPMTLTTAYTQREPRQSYTIFHTQQKLHNKNYTTFITQLRQTPRRSSTDHSPSRRPARPRSGRTTCRTGRSISTRNRAPLRPTQRTLRPSIGISGKRHRERPHSRRGRRS